MKNKFISLAMAFICMVYIMAPVSAEETEQKPFILNVGMLSDAQIEKANQNFTKIDLRELANRDIRDEVEGDGTGGWSDQGENDLRMFDLFGNQEIQHVPFSFINPASNANKAVLALRGQNDMELPTRVEIPVGRMAAGAYFIQASPWCSGVCGTYTWVYEDGSEAYMDIVQNEHICDFWGVSNYDYVRTAWSTTKADGSQRSLYLFAMNNPYPEKKIKSLRLETGGGGAYIMIMAITLTDSGPYLTETESARYITTSAYGWYPYTQPDDDKIAGSALDFSNYLDAPAGKHGYVKSDGDGLVFEDGENAKFWGVDIIADAVFPDKAQAEKTAKHLAQCGVNLVRMKEFDNNLLAEGSMSTVFDGDKLDKLAYFIAQLKERGIYTYLSVLSNRRLRAGDGIEGYETFREGYGIDAYFDDSLIALQQKYLAGLMTYKNPYTGMALSEDPAVCFLEFIDELSIFDYADGYGRNSLANEAQYQKVKAKFNEFLCGKYPSTPQLEKAWTSPYDKNSYETIEEKTIEFKAALLNPLISKGYRDNLKEFLAAVAQDYYSRMKTALGESKILTTINSNSAGKTDIEDTRLNASGDFLIRTQLYADPWGKTDKMSLNSIFDQYHSMTSGTQNIIRDFAQSTVSGIPFIANWGAAMPNLYFSAASVMTAAFAGQKNWTGIQHSFADGSFTNENYIDNFYSIYNNPVRLAMLPVSASIYYSLKPEPLKEMQVSIHQAWEENSEPNLMSASQAFAANTRISFVNEAVRVKKESDTNIIKTNTIYWDTNAGIFEVRSGMTEAVSGFLEQKEELPTFSIETDNAFVTAALTAVDGKTVGDSEHYLLTALCGNQNADSRVNLIRNRYEALGNKEIVIEAIEGTVTLKRAGDYEIYPLTSSGQRKQPLAVKKDRRGYTTIPLSSKNEAIQYEIIRK